MWVFVIAFVLIVAVIFATVSRLDTQTRDPMLKPNGGAAGMANSATRHSVDVRPLTSLLPEQFIVLDLETTGLDPSRHEIIEYGAIRANTDSDTHTGFRTLVIPRKKIPQKITEITGITQAMVELEGLPPIEAFTQFVEFIGDLPLVTFNAQFDMAFLYSAAREHGITINNRYACALKRARRAWPGLQSYRLADLAKMGKLSDEDSHRALGDCKRALIVFTAATSKLGQKVRWTSPPQS